MKTIGIIGGMSPESTVLYYQIINRETNRRLGGNRSAKILLDSVDFEEIVRLQKSGDWAAAGNVLAQSARKLEAGGADFLLLATNTMHKVAPAIEQAAGNVTRVHLELGGKAPAVVFADADIEAAAEGIAAAGIFNSGQDCTAATRVLVEASVAKEFTDALVRHVESLRTGPIPEEEAFYGPLNNARHFDSVQKIVEERPAHSHLLTGGHRVGESGYYYDVALHSIFAPWEHWHQSFISAPIAQGSKSDR